MSNNPDGLSDARAIERVQAWLDDEHRNLPPGQVGAELAYDDVVAVLRAARNATPPASDAAAPVGEGFDQSAIVDAVLPVIVQNTPSVGRSAHHVACDVADTVLAMLAAAPKAASEDGTATPAGSVREADREALAGYRAAVSFIAADAWDGCSDCIEVLRAARAADWQNDQAADPNETARQLARIRAALHPVDSRAQGGEK